MRIYIEVHKDLRLSPPIDYVEIVFKTGLGAPRHVQTINHDSDPIAVVQELVNNINEALKAQELDRQMSSEFAEINRIFR